MMKTILLILMVLGTYAHAGMTDAEIKALIVGPWKGNYCDSSDITEYKPDGTVVSRLNGKDVGVEKWWVEDGELLKTDASIERTCRYKILFLTEREFLILGTTSHAKGYSFQWRTDWDIDNYIPTKR